MKTQSLFLISLVSLAICACSNPLMGSLLQTKTIFFDSNGGSYVPPQTLFNNEKISEPRNPVKAGYYFGGWFIYLDDYYYINDNYDDYYNNYRWDFDVIPDGDMTLYAMWDAKPTPTIDNFIIYGAKEVVYDGNPKEVTVIPQEGITVGKITVYYEDSINTEYGRTSNAPINPGSYWVTFDVEASEEWNSAHGLFAGTLTINNTPAVSDFNIGNLTQFIPNPSYNNISEVTVMPKNGKSSGDITVYYEGTNGTTYDKSTIKPSNIGSYKVTFNIAADTYNNWGAANDLYAGTLEINVFKTIDDLGTWLSAQDPNSIGNPYPVALNVSDLGVSTSSTSFCKSAAGEIIYNSEKYVSLDLSGSTFEYIDARAFVDCGYLTSVIIPNSVINIREGAFQGSSITSVTIGNKVEIIGKGAFFGCPILTSVTIPYSVNRIEDNAFYYCDELKTVIFEKGNIIIGSSAFPDGDVLSGKYSDGGAGTYKYEAIGNTNSWIKQN